MADPSRRAPPLPLVHSFLVCREIFSDERTKQRLLLGPTSHVPVTEFPCQVRQSIFVELTEGRGEYWPRLQLRDSGDEVVWEWAAPAPFTHRDPLLPHDVTFLDLVITVPRAGRYLLVLRLNDEEAAVRSVWYGPAAAFNAGERAT
jgi:hypothetical protein